MTSTHDPSLWRDRFPILNDTTYLVNHSLGAMPVGVVAVIFGQRR